MRHWTEQVDLSTQDNIVLSRLRDRYFDILFERMKDGDDAAARLLAELLLLQEASQARIARLVAVVDAAEEAEEEGPPEVEFHRPKVVAAVYVLPLQGGWAHTMNYAFRVGSHDLFTGPLMDYDVKPTREEAIECELHRILAAADSVLAVKPSARPGEDKVGYAWDRGNKAMKVEARFLKGWAEQELDASIGPAQMVMAL